MYSPLCSLLRCREALISPPDDKLVSGISLRLNPQKGLGMCTWLHLSASALETENISILRIWSHRAGFVEPWPSAQFAAKCEEVWMRNDPNSLLVILWIHFFFLGLKALYLEETRSRTERSQLWWWFGVEGGCICPTGLGHQLWYYISRLVTAGTPISVWIMNIHPYLI